MSLGITKKQLGMVAVLLSGTLVAVLNMTLLTPALPTIMADMGVGSTTVQWLTSGYALVEAVIIPLSAYLMGRLSTRKLFIGGMALFAAGSLCAAVAPNFGVLLLGRMMQAACTGAVMPMVSSIILLVFPREKRGSAMGVIGLIIGFAPALGPTVSGVLVDAVGWRALFVIVTALAALIIAVAFFSLENFGSFKRVGFDAPSVALSTLGLVGVLYGISTLTSDANKAPAAALIVVGLVLLALYVRRQLALEQPMLKVDILKTVRYRTVVVIIAIFQMALVGMETVMPLYIQGVLGQTATVSGLTLLPGALLGAVTGFFAGRIFDRCGVRGPVVVGSVVIGCAALALSCLDAHSAVWAVSIVYACLAVGMQFTMTPLNTWGLNSLPNDVIQHAQCTSNTINQVAGSFGTALLVSLSALAGTLQPDLAGVEQLAYGYHLSFSGTTVLALVSVALILVFVRNRTGAAAPAAVPGTITVEQAMNPEAASVRSDAKMRDVLALMAQRDTNGVSVVDRSGNLVGYVTDGDVVAYLASLSKKTAGSFSRGDIVALVKEDDDVRQRFADLGELDVMRLATKKVVTVDAGAPLDEACAILAERRIKKVPVTRDGKLVGALSRRNVMHYCVDVLAQS